MPSVGRLRSSKQVRVLSLVLVAAVWLLAGGTEAAPFQPGGVKPETMVPADAQIFAVVRVAELWKQDVVQKAVAELEKKLGEKLTTELQNKLGLTLADLDTIIFVSLDPRMDRAWVAFSASKPFDRAKIIKTTELEPAERKYRDKVYHKDKNAKEMVHVGEKTLIVTPNEESMKAALDQLTGNRQTIPGKLAGSVSRLGGKEQFILGGVISREAVKGLNGPGVPPQLGPLSALETGTVAITIKDGTAHLELAGTYPDADKAGKAKEALVEFLKTLPALAVFIPDKEIGERIKQLANAVKASQSATTVKAVATQPIKGEELIRVIESMQPRRKQAVTPPDPVRPKKP